MLETPAPSTRLAGLTGGPAPTVYVIVARRQQFAATPDPEQKKGRSMTGREVFRRGCLKGTLFVHRTKS
jgi:hypothetical protein